jgi:hypothetical protein
VGYPFGPITGGAGSQTNSVLASGSSAFLRGVGPQIATSYPVNNPVNPTLGTAGWTPDLKGTVTWSPTDKPAGVTLSSGNLVATLSSTPIPIMFRATAGRSIGSGSFYFEAVFSASGVSSSVGVANLAASVNTYLGGTVNEIAYGINGQIVWNSASRGGALTTVATWVVGDVIGVLVDINVVAFYKNGTQVYSSSFAPTAVPTGDLYPACCFNQVGDTAKGNFTLSSITTLPAGATAWDGVDQTAVLYYIPWRNRNYVRR